MKNFKEQIDDCNIVYYNSINLEEINKTIKKLQIINLESTLNEENKINLIGVYARLNAKKFAIEFFKSPLTSSNLLKFKNKIDKIEDMLKENESKYQNTFKLFEHIFKEISKYVTFLEPILIQRSKLNDSNQSNNTDMIDCFNSIISILNKGILDIKNIEFSYNNSENYISFIDVNELILDNLKIELDNILKQKESFFKDKYNTLFEEICKKQLNNTYQYKPILFADNDLGKINFICSPLESEVDLAVSALSKNYLTIDCSLINLHSMNDFLDYTFSKCSKIAEDYLLLGLSKTNDEVLNLIYSFLNKQTINNKRIFINDLTPSNTLYNKYLELVDKDKQLTIAYKYLPLPDSIKFLDILRTNNMIEKTDEEHILTKMIFTGYVGLNKAIIQFISSKDNKWYNVAYDYDSNNYKKSLNYIKELIIATHFIDDGWVHNIKGTGQIIDKKPFSYDYDALKEYNINNIKKIVESPSLTFRAKVGSLVRYCLFHGDDKLVWDILEKDEKKKRIINASKLLTQMLLKTEHDPIVKVEKLREDVGGECRRGGIEIAYSNIYLTKVFHLEEVIIHECFHSFQYTMMVAPIEYWHEKEFLLTSFRTNFWKNNSMNYTDIGNENDTYSNQILEADTVIFTNESVLEANRLWATIDFE